MNVLDVSQYPSCGSTYNRCIRSFSASSSRVCIQPPSLLNNLKDLKCLNVPPTIPGTPATDSSKMTRSNQFLSESKTPFWRNFVMDSIEGGFSARTSGGIGSDL